MPKFEDFTFQSSTGVNTIHALKCVPDTPPKAVVQIAHGIAEHIDRYRPFMSFLAENGYLAVGNDHLGHGKSITEPGQQGFFAEKDGWAHVVADMDLLHDLMKKEYPDIPYIFFGHSMGSFLTRTYLIKHPNKYDAANSKRGEDVMISTPDSKVKVFVIPTNEELVIARDTKAIVG